MKEAFIQLSQLQLLLKYVQAAFPREASGIILNQEFKEYGILSFVETSSEENTPFTFCIRDVEIKKVSASLKKSEKKVCGCFHSHIFGSARPSKYDCAAKKEVGDLWLIFSVKFSDFKIYRWDGKIFHKQKFRIIQ